MTRTNLTLFNLDALKIIAAARAKTARNVQEQNTALLHRLLPEMIAVGGKIGKRLKRQRHTADGPFKEIDARDCYWPGSGNNWKPPKTTTANADGLSNARMRARSVLNPLPKRRFKRFETEPLFAPQLVGLDNNEVTTNEVRRVYQASARAYKRAIFTRGGKARER